MDIQLPGMDGYGASRELRSLGFSGPIVAVTAHAMEDEKEKCLAAGCDDYIIKPLNKESISSK
jgi:CheY-like chemotaxis protein